MPLQPGKRPNHSFLGNWAASTSASRTAVPNVAGRGGLLQHVFQPGLRPGYRPIRGSGRHPITQLNVASTSAGWVSRDPKALAEAREKLSLSFVIIKEAASRRGA